MHIIGFYKLSYINTANSILPVKCGCLPVAGG